MLIRKNTFVESWYTPGRTSMALHNYADLVAVDDQFGAVEIVADLRHAALSLPDRDGEIMCLLLLDGYTRYDVARELYNYNAREDKDTCKRKMNTADQAIGRARRCLMQFLCEGVR